MIAQIRMRVLSLPRRWKQAILVAFDFAALSCALWASFCLRYDNWYVPYSLDQWAIVVSAPIVAIPIFIRMGLYRSVVRYLPERAMWTIMQAMLLATVVWVVAVFLSEMAGRGVVPRSVPVIYFGIGTFIVAGSRFVAKWAFLSKLNRQGADHKAIVIYGAGDLGLQIAQSLRSTHYIAGFIDDNPGLHRREMGGIRVYGPGKLRELVSEYGVADVILSISSLTTQRRKEIVASVSEHGVKIRTLPSIVDLVTGKYLVSQIKEIDIVELLGRSSVPPDPELIRSMVVGRSIMVTGAGGSIGSELCRKIARWSPQRLVLFEANEFALYQIEQELADLPDLSVVPVLGSVIDQARVKSIIMQNDVKVVFHAAAHKHVPLVEANALEGIKNNIFGTHVVAETAYTCGVENFVLISTDKAVRPTNVMGATKRWAELIVSDVAARAEAAGTGQRFCAVRFGNVLGSNGSVVPLFKKQIAQGGPITLTDAAMTRYFMSIQEAAELIVQAGALSEGGDVFLLDMGEPILISDLAENMVRLAGLTVRNQKNPDGDIEIVVTGKRPGEKLYEELFYDSASAEFTQHAKIMRANSRSQVLKIADEIGQIREAVSSNNEHSARHVLFDLVRRSG
ncbi:polysaccharide biosynthesis protein (plasmid) [Devosia neptuniae]|uniref:Polysaccharide biosynthesis protein n=1 Tax=Devosia neptuniae TaxID=191302 RepID=A0ABY6C9T2_9HYPH|nr:nucleoside-diphosphate sugar epimerase/dehydratase [Devosia neptuniae]UXN67842.1 polysaccharide biosynthesis protein [Devosia neptuniae]